MNNDQKKNSFAYHMVKVGTPECAIFGAVVAMALALLFLALGFWKTVLIAVLAGVGAFLGGVKDKKEWARSLINRLFPPRDQVPFKEQNEEIRRAMQEMRQAAQEEPAAQPLGADFQPGQEEQNPAQFTKETE